MARLAALLPLLALAACKGERTFDGTYTGLSLKQRAVTMTLKQEGKSLSGIARMNEVEATLVGTVEGDRASGTIRQADMGFEANFEAVLKGDTVEMTYIYPNGQRQPMTFTRTTAKAEAEARPDIDEGLVGRWHADVEGTGDDGKAAKARIVWNLEADGAFEYGGAEGISRLKGAAYGPGSKGSAGPTAAARGRWRCDGQVLHARVEGGAWAPLGRYVLSGDELTIYGADGGKQVWTRE